LALINALGAPLAATSANLSGQASPTSADQVVEQLKGRVPLVIDGGQCPVRVSSTVIDLSVSPPRLLRAGAIPTEKLNDLLPDLTS
jgi:L-threonylcarbamoyladenylate synthase